MITSPQARIDEYTQKGWWGRHSLHQLLQQRVESHPDMLAVADQFNRSELDGRETLRLSFAELDTASDNLAESLLSHGIALDDIVIVQLPNIAELVVCYYALSKIGAIISPVAIQYGQHELSEIQTSLKAKALITADRHRDAALGQLAQSLDLKLLCFADIDPSLQIDPSELQCPALTAHRALYSSQINDANRVLTICWTSGTTGTPKGVPRSHNMWLSTTQAVIEACDYLEGDKLLNPFPLINMAAIGGFLFPAALRGCTIVLHQPFDPAIYLQQLQAENINFTIAPPAVLNQLAKSPDMWSAFDFSDLRCVGSGSAPLAPWMIETFAEQYGKQVVNFYGSNEGICLLSNQQTAPSPEQRASMFPRLGAAGLPWSGGAFDFAATKVVDPDSGEIIDTPGVAGELLINGPTIFDGYFNHTQRSEVFSNDGYFRTGDLVEICGDPPHHYRIVGRCKDIINRGGVKISPSELDQLLEGFTGLKEAAVCAYTDSHLGEKVCACVVPIDDSAPPTLAELCEFLTQLGIAKYKLPERLEILAELPRNPMNKVMRSELRRVVEQSR